MREVIQGQSPYGLPQYIAIEFDNPKVGILAKKSKAGFVLLEPHASQKIRRGTKTHVRHQYALKVAFASTVHKVQGATMDKIVVNMKKINRPGQAYVAFSRCTSLQGLAITDFSDDHVFSDPKVAPALASMPSIPDYLLSPIKSLKTESDHNHFVAVHFNVQSLPKHYSNLMQQKHIYFADIITLTETWLPHGTRSTDFPLDGNLCYLSELYIYFYCKHHSRSQTLLIVVQFSGYTANHYPRSVSHGGGISVYYKENLDVTTLLIHEDNKLNHLVAVI